MPRTASSKPLLIGITGGSGSGKTSFLDRLRSHFTPEAICLISQDNYYHPRDQQREDERGIRNFDLPDAIDKKAFVKDLKSLIKGHKVVRQEYTFNNEKREPGMLEWLPAPIVIVEGLFVLHFKKVRKLLDLKVYLHAKENLKVIRRIKRDREERNYPLEDVLYRYENHVLPTFEKYVKPYSEEADLVINNNTHFDMGLQVMVGYVRDRLREVAPDMLDSGSAAGEPG